MYSTVCNRFIFRPESLSVASTKIMPHHFARLRIMDFSHSFGPNDREDWAYLCKIIAGMTNLHTLYMSLHYTATTYDDDHEKHRSAGLRHIAQKFFGNPKIPDPISEEFILDSLYQIQQVKKFEVQLDDRYKGTGVPVPTGHSNAPFKLICEYAEDVDARNKQLQQERRERESIKRQEEAEKRRLIMAQREADRLRFEMEQKAQDIVQSYQSFSG